MHKLDHSDPYGMVMLSVGPTTEGGEWIPWDVTPDAEAVLGRAHWRVYRG